MPLSSLLLPMAFIGGGNMASALIGGLVKNGTPPSAIHVVEPHLKPPAKHCRRNMVSMCCPLLMRL
jgi:pyrroline-5-carboxylate reductase